MNQDQKNEIDVADAVNAFNTVNVVNTVDTAEDHLCSLFDDLGQDSFTIKSQQSDEKQKLIIQKQAYDDVKTHDKIKYNTNNIWTNKIKPSDYDEVLSKGFTRWWIDKFSPHYVVINLPITHWMTLASSIGAMTGTFSKLYEEDLDDYVEKYETPFIKDYLDKNDVFIRGESVSLKQGMHGVGPYRSLRQIVESMVTASSGHSVFDSRDTLQTSDKMIKLYLMRWVDIIEFQEFRVFVKDRKITAISQQSLYRRNTILENLSEEERTIIIERWTHIITNYFSEVIVNKLSHVSDYCIDIAILKDDIPYFIEINSFGMEYASGSSLFEWVTDKDILYGEKPGIYFRYTL